MKTERVIVDSSFRTVAYHARQSGGCVQFQPLAYLDLRRHSVESLRCSFAVPHHCRARQQRFKIAFQFQN